MVDLPQVQGMPKPPDIPATSATADAAEADFYAAMQAADVERLMACWSEDEDIVCIHPGGNRVAGNAAVRASFAAIFANSGPIAISPEQILRADTAACTVHHVLEKVEVLTDQGPVHAYAVATNVYFQTVHGWRMVAHHASAMSPSLAQDMLRPPQVLH
jgi:ketosteroid isomerase-like protein